MIKIGLEIHGYINTKEKLFCSCQAIHGAKLTRPNVNICPICTGQPGAKPMAPNTNALDKAIQIAQILSCKTNQESSWQRKHYSWPDLPKGYQNTLSGPHAIPTGQEGIFQGIKIKECHLEEDPAAWNPKTGEIDYNRAGIPLIEIVTEPDFKSSEQVERWLKSLVATLSYIKIIDKSLGIKSDVNVSVKESGYVRIEIKNVNSITNIKEAIDSEIARQKKLGKMLKEQETRRYDPLKKQTMKMRSKEAAEDYRFISDPDLIKMSLSKERIAGIKVKTPETPFEKLEKILKKHKIPRASAEVLTKNIDFIGLFESAMKSKTKSIKPELAVRWITEELFSVLNYNKKTLDDIDFKESHFTELLELISQGKLSEPKAREILRSWTSKSSSPKENLEKHSQISDKSELESIIKETIKKNPQAVKDYISGKEWAINFLIGKVMHATNKRANYTIVKDLLIKKLKQ